jgi:hypothetical protein
MTEPLYCKKHKEKGMVNVKFKKRVASVKSPKEKKPRVPKEKKPPRKRITKKCPGNNCNVVPSFNMPGETKGIYCLAHKLPDMVNVKFTKCLDKDCGTSAVFNTPGETKGVLPEKQRASIAQNTKSRAW